MHESTPLLITVGRDPEGRALGWVAVDTTVADGACGGLRMLPDVSGEELRVLARAMTLKYGLLGLPQGGSKGGVVGDPEAPVEERRQRLHAFARALAPLLASRFYRPGPDMGTTNADVRWMLESIGMRLGARELRGSRSGVYTAVGVFATAREALRIRGFDARGATAAIEGMGKVGMALAGLLSTVGVKITAVSTSRGAIYREEGFEIARLQQLNREHGSAFVHHYPGAEPYPRLADLLEAPVTILCPCARHHTIHEGNAAQIRAHIICPGANAPVTAEAEHLLEERGRLVLPDFLTNAGGVLGGTMEFASVPDARVQDFVAGRIGHCTTVLMERARRSGQTLRTVSEQAALEGHRKVAAQASRTTLRSAFTAASLALYRKGWMPAGWMGATSMEYFDRQIARSVLG
jgi:glutamate dehydrogenase (NAD(P)+)